MISRFFSDDSEEAVAHIATSLTTPKKNIGKIEKEAVVVVYAVKRFHTFVFGRHFTLLIYRKPSSKVFGPEKGLQTYSANCLQHWAKILT